MLNALIYFDCEYLQRLVDDKWKTTWTMSIAYNNNKKQWVSYPELTGGIIATSSPSPTTLSVHTVPSSAAADEDDDGGKSTYSNPTLTLQLPKTFSQMPGYRSSSRGNNFDRGKGAGKDSPDFPVYADADAK